MAQADHTARLVEVQEAYANHARDAMERVAAALNALSTEEGVDQTALDDGFLALYALETALRKAVPGAQRDAW